MIDLKNIPEVVLDALRERGHADATIAKMRPQIMFAEYCNWHGLIDWGPGLWRLVLALSKLDAQESDSAATILTRLELAGKVRRLPKGRYELI